MSERDIKEYVSKNPNVKFLRTMQSLTLKSVFLILVTLILRYQNVKIKSNPMNREDLRLVEFTVIEKSKPKKGKKTVKKEKKKIGLFHLWGTNVNGKGNEKFYGLIEDAQTGSLLEVSFKDIRFLNEDEIEELTEEALEEAEELFIELDETTEFPAEAVLTEEATAGVPAETTTEEKPKRAPRSKKA